MTRVVVVEDSKTQAFRLKSVLVKAGFSVELTSNGEAGLAACLAEPPDLVISDIVMPKMDGYALCRALRSNEATAKVPVLLLTSLAEPLDAVRALAAGADNFVTKPYEDGALLARVRRTVGGDDGEPGPGVLELEGERFEITAPPRRVLQVLGSALEDAAVRAKENARLLAEAETANRLKDDFLATVSHELRTPLNAILGWTQILAGRQNDSSTLARALEIVERNARAQATLIEDVLDVSRVASGKVALERQLVDLREVLSNAVLAMTPGAEAKGIEIRAEHHAAAKVLGDPSRLAQVMLNVLSNAIKFTPGGGRITVSLDVLAPSNPGDSEHAVLSVRDTGRGIPKSFLPHVFERFRQADPSTTREQGGLGLGLAIVKHLVELHGGTVSAHSMGTGQGSTFTVKLPIATEDEAAPRAEPTHPGGEPRALPLAGLSVLLVEDDADGRELMELMLARAGARATSVHDAATALRVLDTDRFDVILSDIAMPGEDGISFISRARPMLASRGLTIPAIALTAYGGTGESKRFASAGFDGHVVKPVEQQRLIDAVINVLADDDRPRTS